MRRAFFTTFALPTLREGVLIPKCGACKLDRTCRSPKMPVSGEGRKKILIVAEAPGEEEDREGVQLVGNSGRELVGKTRRYGVEMRRDCWLTNSLICRPPNNKIKDPKAIGYCRPNLINTIRELKPELIILLGSVAVQSFFGYYWRDRKKIGGVTRWAGYQIPMQSLNTWVCPMFHPAAILHSKERVTEMMFNEHLAAACKLAGKGRPWKSPPNYNSEVEVLYGVSEVVSAINEMHASSSVVAFDYETNMLKPDSDKAEIVTCSISNGKRTIAFPWQGAAVRLAMAELLMDPKVKKIAANAKFEDRWTRAVLGVEIDGWCWDTMLAAHAIENASKTRLISGLKFQAFVRFGQEPWDTKVSPYLESQGGGGNTPNRIREAPLEELLRYNGLDSLLEFKLALLQRDMIYKKGD